MSAPAHASRPVTVTLERTSCLRDAWPDLVDFDAGYDTPIWGEPTFASLLEHVVREYPRHACAKVLAAERTVGLYGFLPFPEAGPEALETLVYLRPDARGSGVGRTLVAASAVAAAKTGTPLYADVRTSNALSLRFHVGLLGPAPGPRHASPFGYDTCRWLLTGAQVRVDDDRAELVMPALVSMLTALTP